MKKYRVVLFQFYLRQFVLNFGKVLKQGEFITKNSQPKRTLYATLPTFDNEVKRSKTNWKYWLRRILGIPNIRIRYEREGDILFTYGTLLLTNKPYCAYLETGLSFYNYDLGIGKNPIARFFVSLLATRKNCHRIIFLSEASKKSFFSTLFYPRYIRNILEKKSLVIYPLPLVEREISPAKSWKGKLKVLFVGMYYMKGGVELVKAFERLRENSQNIELTIVTPVHTLKESHATYLQSISGLTLFDAKMDTEGMRRLYREHDIFCLPTYRDGFGLVLIEALSYGMPLIITDQYATPEMVQENENGFVYHGHPLMDYEAGTYRLLGQYYNPKKFYADLFKFQAEGKMKPIEDFLYASLKRFLDDPSLLEKFSKNSLSLYQEKFHADHIGEQIEHVFLGALEDKKG